MTCSVICISRTLGAGGEEVARLVAERLGYRYVDDEIIGRAAHTAGVSAETVEQAEHTRPLVLRIMESLALVPLSEAGEVFVAPSFLSANYSHLIEHVIREVASEGNAVIVAHGASIPLTGTPGVLRVFITASPAARTSRLAAAQTMEQKAAAKAIEDSDRERARYLKRFYDISGELPTHYDLTINTDSLPADRAAELVVQAAASSDSPPAASRAEGTI